MSLTCKSISPFDDFFEVDMKQVKEYGYFNRGNKVEKKIEKPRQCFVKIDTYWLEASTQFSFDEQQLEEYGQTI